MTKEEYDRSVCSDPKSRLYLEVSAAYVNLATRAAPSKKELESAVTNGPFTVIARAFGTLTNLALAVEIAIKGKLDNTTLEEIGLEPVNTRRGHDLRYLFYKLSQSEQEQLRLCVNNALPSYSAGFDALLDQCKTGFMEWRYFFEDDKKDLQLNYNEIKLFLYASAYYFISGEGKDACLEETKLKKYMFVSESGLYARQRELEKEYNEAREIALRDGDGVISDSDREWLRGIREKYEIVIKRIEELNECYPEYPHL